MIQSLKKPFNKLIAPLGIGLMLASTPAWADTPQKGSDTTAEPVQLAQVLKNASHPVEKKVSIPAPQGRLLYTDIREWSEDARVEAPKAFSEGRICVIIYGSGEEAQKAISYAGNKFAAYKKMDIAYLHAPDNNESPNDVQIKIFANRDLKFTLDVGKGIAGKRIARDLILDMKSAYNDEFRKPVVQAKGASGENPEPTGVN